MAETFRLLFVCTGNTCRSPMAEAIAREKIQARGWTDIEVRSAGTSAFGAGPASGGALRAAGKHGLDLSNHRSQPVTADLLEAADLILAMTPSHLMRVLELGGQGRAALLSAFAAGADGDPGGQPVPDPFGGSDEVYEATFELLEQLVEQSLSHLEPHVKP